MCKSNDRDALEKYGLYKLKCVSCCGVYLGQTGRNFKTRFKEHISDMYNREKPGIHVIYKPQGMKGLKTLTVSK
jgi:hypothetical protein